MSATVTRLRSVAAELPACQATVVYRFADGWTVRTLQTLGDVHREGGLMSNCLEFLPEDIEELISRHGEQWMDAELEGDGYDAYRSLRDPDNLPRLLWQCGEDEDRAVVSEMRGRHNCQPKLEYYTRVQQWAANAGKPVELYQPPRGEGMSTWWADLATLPFAEMRARAGHPV